VHCIATAMTTIDIYTEVGVFLPGSSASEELFNLSVKRTDSVSNLCWHYICKCCIFQSLCLTRVKFAVVELHRVTVNVCNNGDTNA